MIAQELAGALTRIEFTSHLVASLLYVIAGMLLNSKNGKLGFYRPLQLACYITAITQLVVAAHKIHWLDQTITGIVEIANLGFWAVALWRLLEASTGKKVPAIFKAATGLIWTASAVLLLNYQLELALFGERLSTSIQITIGPILLTLATLVLIEQIFRNSTSTHRHNIKYLVIGLLVLMFTSLYSLSYYSLFHAYDNNLNSALGLINLLVAALFIFGSLRTQPEQSVSISRKMAFYSSALLMAGLFLLCMSLAGYYAKLQGAPWSAALQLVLFVFTFISLCVAASSRSIRANIQVFVNKHFFRHKYDYRHVWLNLIKTLSHTGEHEDFYLRSLKAVAEIFNSQGGSLWLRDEQGTFEQVTLWNMHIPNHDEIDSNSDFVSPFIEKEWVYALGDSGNNLIDPYFDHLPDWVHSVSDGWVIAPLIIGNKLTGFFMLSKPANASPLIWEDLDVLKTVGRQLASYIVRQKSAEQLAEAKQFDTYHKLTAFIMHDLKNLIAQQALVVQNANKHKENPAFVEDAIKTIDNSVARMSHLLKRLQSSGQTAPQRSVSLQKILLEAIRKSTDRQPIPTLREQTADVNVVADQEQLVMILMHVIRNAQDATSSDGFIDISFVADATNVMIEIEDNGSGMDQEFLRNRLFKPFESTKSSMGMGIGAYQVREFIQNMGGQIKVASELTVGTTICILLPISKHESDN